MKTGKVRGTASSPPFYCKELVIVRQNAEQLQSFLKGGVPREFQEKRYVSAWQAESCRIEDVSGPCNYHDRNHELLSNDTCIYHFPSETGAGANMRFADPIFSNYKRILADKVFQQSIANTFLYLIIQVPIMLILAILLAQLLNNKDLKFKGFFRTCVFLPCATSLVSYSLIFRSMFATDGLINSILIKLGILSTGYNFLGNSASAKIVIILALIWRWTGYNMVFYLSQVLQNIEYSVYEAAKIDGANGWKTFWKITVPLLKPTIIMTFIMSINGTLQLFDESVNLTKGGPANSTITMSHYIYNTCFINVPNFGYAAAMSFIIFIMVAVLAFINLKVGDTRD